MSRRNWTRTPRWPYHCDEPVYSVSEEADRRRRRKDQWHARHTRVLSMRRAWIKLQEALTPKG